MPQVLWLWAHAERFSDDASAAQAGGAMALNSSSSQIGGVSPADALQAAALEAAADVALGRELRHAPGSLCALSPADTVIASWRA